MDTLERKYRFSEIMSTVSLLPDIQMTDDSLPEEVEMVTEWVLPNLTKGLSDEPMKNAILCQAFREDEEFKFKLIALLTNSAQEGLVQAKEADTKPNNEDLEALAICANILWAEGQAKGLFQLLGMLGSVCTAFDVEIPSLATMFLRSNSNVSGYGKLDPIAILEGSVSDSDISKAAKETVQDKD